MSDTFDPYHRWLGIPPKHQPPDYYRLLALERFEDDEEVIRDATEQRMAHVRNYRLGEHAELAQQLLNELGRAKACLLDNQKRAEYDEHLPAAANQVASQTQHDGTARVSQRPPTPLEPLHLATTPPVKSKLPRAVRLTESTVQPDPMAVSAAPSIDARVTSLAAARSKPEYRQRKPLTAVAGREIRDEARNDLTQRWLLIVGGMASVILTLIVLIIVFMAAATDDDTEHVAESNRDADNAPLVPQTELNTRDYNSEEGRLGLPPFPANTNDENSATTKVSAIPNGNEKAAFNSNKNAPEEVRSTPSCPDPGSPQWIDIIRELHETFREIKYQPLAAGEYELLQNLAQYVYEAKVNEANDKLARGPRTLVAAAAQEVLVDLSKTPWPDENGIKKLNAFAANAVWEEGKGTFCYVEIVKSLGETISVDGVPAILCRLIGTEQSVVIPVKKASPLLKTKSRWLLIGKHDVTRTFDLVDEDSTRKPAVLVGAKHLISQPRRK